MNIYLKIKTPPSDVLKKVIHVDHCQDQWHRRRGNAWFQGYDWHMLRPMTQLLVCRKFRRCLPLPSKLKNHHINTSRQIWLLSKKSTSFQSVEQAQQIWNRVDTQDSMSFFYIAKSLRRASKKAILLVSYLASQSQSGQPTYFITTLTSYLGSSGPNKPTLSIPRDPYCDISMST